MKKTTLILSIAALVGAAVLCASCANNGAQTNAASQEGTSLKGAIVYFDMGRLMNEYDLANDLGSAAESKTNSISDEINRRGNKLQKEVNEFQSKIDKGLLTRSVAEQQGQKLAQKQQEFQNYTAQKQQEINEELAVMQNQIADAIKTFVDKYTEEQGFALVLSTQGDILPLPVVAANPELDITDALLEGLNKEYVEQKAKADKK